MRRLLIAAAFALCLAGAACGDGPDKPEQTGQATATSDPNGPPPTVAENQQPQVPDRQMPTPTPVPDGLPVIQVVVAGKTFTPVRSEFAGLPKVTVTAGGTSYEGVSLEALATKAGAQPSAVATIQGTRTDNLRLGSIRYALAEIGPSTVLVMDESGHIRLASSSVPSDQWLKDITGIALN
jgi:hypothetical protein